VIAINLVFEDQLSEAVLRVILKQSRKNFEVLRCFPDLTRRHSDSLKRAVNAINNFQPIASFRSF
jgi:hypothetical protein